MGYVECSECGHHSGCNGEIKFYKFDWHVRPRADHGPSYWSTIVFPYCIKHINALLERHSHNPRKKVWTAGRDNWDAFDGLSLD